MASPVDSAGVVDGMDAARAARLFWAAGLDAPAAEFATAECARISPLLQSPKIRWQPRDNWHLTLLFLGQSTIGQGLAMAAALRAPLAALSPFAVQLDPASWFPSLRHPLVIALPAHANAPVLALVSAVAESAREAGVPHEARPFRGHVSIARAKRGYRPRDELPAGAGHGELRIDHVALYESVSAPDGANYVPLLRLPLGG